MQSPRTTRIHAARAFLILLCLAMIAMIATAQPAHAQRDIPDNPYPRTLKTPTPAPTSKTAKAKFTLDSLRAEYPVSSKNEACWRFTDDVANPVGDNGYCRRDRGTVLNDQVDLGNLHTFYRGNWANRIVSDRLGTVIMHDGTRSRKTAAAIQTE